VFTVVNGVVQAKPNTFSKTRPGEALSLDEWLADAAREFPFLFLPSNGSGAPPQGGGGGSGGGSGRSGVTVLRDPTPEQLGLNADAILRGTVEVVFTGEK
jgi:hypothetical protein